VGLRFTRVLQFNFEDAEAYGVDRITGAMIVELAVRLGANTITLFARDAFGRAFYDSKIAPKIAKLGKRDLLREVVEEARKKGIDVVAMVGHTTNPVLYSKHPDWAQVDREGKVITMDTDPPLRRRDKPSWPLMCLNSPFIDHVKSEIEEVLAYGVSGVFLDSFRYMPDADRACFCNACRRLFKEEKGYEPPEEANLDSEAYREAFKWRLEVNVRRLRELKAHIHTLGKGAILAYNSHPYAWRGRANTIAEQAKDSVDVFFAECSEADYQPPGFIAEMVKLTRALTGKSVWASRNSFHTTLTPQQTSPLAIRMGLREAFAGGGWPLFLVFASTFINGVQEEAVRVAFREVEKLEDYMARAKPLRYVGIVWSNRSRDWSGSLGQHIADSFRGYYYALLKEGLPVNYVSDTSLDSGDFSGYKAIIMENVRSLSGTATSNLKRYADKGGGIVAAYKTGVLDENGGNLEETRLSEVLGIRFNGVLRADWSYFEILDPTHALFKGVNAREILIGDFDKEFMSSRVPPELGWQALVESEAQKLARIVLPSREYGNEYENGRSPPPPTVKTEHPAILAGENWVYFSGQVGRAYWRTGLPSLGSLILNTVIYTAGPPPVQALSPGFVELEAYESSSSEILVHLLNHTYADRIITRSNTCPNTSWTSTADAVHPPTKVVPLSVKLVFRGVTPRKVYSPLTNKEYRVEKENDYYLTEVGLNEYEFLVVEHE